MPPTPQQSFAPPAGSPQGHTHTSSNQATGMVGGGYGHSYSMSFDSPHGYSQQQQPQQHGQAVYAQSFATTSNSQSQGAPGYARSFGGGGGREGYGQGQGQGQGTGYMEKPQIYTAVYSGVSVYELEIAGIACMRRRSDGWLNATQILKVAGVDKGKRTKVLEKEILVGEHEKVQGGYGKYQGTWISYRRGREFCRQYGVEDILRPLLDYDVSADGSGGMGQDTPTKEQAMAANRKRFYQPSVDGGRPGPQNGGLGNGGGNGGGGTFFQNISPGASVALAAMNKAARLNSPAPGRGSMMRHPSQQDGMMPSASQQSMASQASFADDSSYGTQQQQQSNGEPPRKRLRRDDNSQDGMAPPALPLDASMRSVSPTEPNESFLYDGAAGASQERRGSNGEPLTLPPLPSPSTEEQREKHAIILDLFTETGSRTDYSSHPALTTLSPEDLNMPLDNSANNALHWSATLAKVELSRLLVKKGANMWRGNAAGQSPLVSAVLVGNSWEKGCFAELLDLLGGLIELRDSQGRTVVHHIAVSSGIKGRGGSCKYYLEGVLEYLVRIGTQTQNHGSGVAGVAVAGMKKGVNGESSSQDSVASNNKGGVSLARFLAHVVNARDMAGNTALNLVARIGNRSIIQQLLEIGGDPGLPNHKGVCARDFGVGTEAGEQAHVNGGLASQQSMQMVPNTQDSALADGEGEGLGTQIEELSGEIVESMTVMLTQNLASHKELLRVRTVEIDRLNAQIREFSAMQQADLERLREVKERVKVRGARRDRIESLKRAILERKSVRSGNKKRPAELDTAWLEAEDTEEILEPNTPDASPTAAQRAFLSTHSVPSPKTLQARVNAYLTHNATLQGQADELKGRSREIEDLYRRVVSLCTGVEEGMVVESLPALVAAVESERGGVREEEAGRVREFLRRVDGGGGGVGES
ncbi:transcriptional regulator swi6 [Elasticomyces elasticus]|nr:transcriptional regulator swi6 [Elasticomyces elasticus]KAK3647698.1 transcriptional regulator swi6 [Elasticomyces elasticus]KAK4908115.1 transcriptional regulator swi6 [Elasticomyces elasticus]KAK5748086.1 transcriptional regulator swi6 [Elasticomyces elasticus]